MEDKWTVLKEKMVGMSQAMELFNNGEAKKAYDHVLVTMEVCEKMENNGELAQ